MNDLKPLAVLYSVSDCACHLAGLNISGLAVPLPTKAFLELAKTRKWQVTTYSEAPSQNPLMTFDSSLPSQAFSFLMIYVGVFLKEQTFQ